MSRVVPFGFSGYRSFGQEVQYIPAHSRLNLIAGPNNCGKSNILRFLAEQYNNAVGALPHPTRGPSDWSAFTGFDVPEGEDVGRRFSVGIELGGERYDRLVTEVARGRPEIADAFHRLLTTVLVQEASGLPRSSPRA
jgi:hypothetical protein